MGAGIVYVESMCQVSKESVKWFSNGSEHGLSKGSFEKNAFKVLKGKKVKKKLVNNFSLMDLKLWEYIFEMFNYKIRQKKIDFFKITNPYPALNRINCYNNVSHTS